MTFISELKGWYDAWSIYIWSAVLVVWLLSEILSIGFSHSEEGFRFELRFKPVRTIFKPFLHSLFRFVLFLICIGLFLCVTFGGRWGFELCLENVLVFAEWRSLAFCLVAILVALLFELMLVGLRFVNWRFLILKEFPQWLQGLCCMLALAICCGVDMSSMETAGDISDLIRRLTRTGVFWVLLCGAYLYEFCLGLQQKIDSSGEFSVSKLRWFAVRVAILHMSILSFWSLRLVPV